MSVKKSIFASEGERAGFKSIERTWGDRYRLVPQFPFSALFDADENVRNTANLFYKTSIDYVLCTKEGQPLLAIDFDGLDKGHGSSYGTYQQSKVSTDPQRKLNLNSNLGMLGEAAFPITSWPQTNSNT